METIGKKIRIARFNADLDQKQLAEIINVPKEYISYWESDKRTPNLEQIEALSKILKVTPNYFFGMEENVTIKETSGDTVNLRLAGEVSCGNLTYATSEDGEYLTEEMPKSFFSKYGKTDKKDIEDQYFVLTAKGDSMNPYIENRDTLICRRVQDLNSGKIGVVVSPDSEATVKVISKAQNEIRLIPLNKKFDEKIITANDGEYKIIAEVVYVIRKVGTFIL